jgi:hypothetical protein
MLSVVQNIEWNGRTVNEYRNDVERKWKWSCPIWAINPAFASRDWEEPQKSYVRIADVLAEIGIGHLQNVRSVAAWVKLLDTGVCNSNDCVRWGTQENGCSSNTMIKCWVISVCLTRLWMYVIPYVGSTTERVWPLCSTTSPVWRFWFPSSVENDDITVSVSLSEMLHSQGFLDTVEHSMLSC